MRRYLALMERCWAEDEHARPTFEEVLAELDDLRSCESGHARLRGGESQRCACMTVSTTLPLLHGLSSLIYQTGRNKIPSSFLFSLNLSVMYSVHTQGSQ